MWSAAGSQQQASTVPTRWFVPRAFEQAQPLLTLLDVVWPRDTTFAMHGESVGRLAALTAEQLGLSAADAGHLRLAGILHDIGKVAISDHVLQKPAPLNDLEWACVRRHPDIGHRLIRSIGLDEIAGWVRCHHERPDGRGYPRGLLADEIPIQGSILAVADAYHAMADERPYQRAMSTEEAMAELAACSGTQFDPEVVIAVGEVLGKPPIHPVA